MLANHHNHTYIYIRVYISLSASKHEVVQKTFEKCFAHEQADVSVQGLKVPLSEQWMRLAERR